jgi:hypothetical protein
MEFATMLDDSAHWQAIQAHCHQRTKEHPWTSSQALETVKVSSVRASPAAESSCSRPIRKKPTALSTTIVPASTCLSGKSEGLVVARWVWR